MSGEKNRKVPVGYVLLLVALVILSQYVITGWVFDYGSNPDVVSHVSFAGTLSSIILAVLAIVYAYYQTFAQQRDSSALSAQIEVLRSTIVTSKENQSDLSGDLERLTEISEKIDLAISIGEQSTKASSDLRAEMRDSFSKFIAEKESAKVGHPAEYDVEAVARRVATIAYPLQTLAYVVIAEAIRRRMDSLPEAFSKFVRPAISDNSAWVDQYLQGFISGSLYLLWDLQIAKGTVNSGSMLESFERMVRKTFEDDAQMKVAVDWVDIGKVRALITSD